MHGFQKFLETFFVLAALFTDFFLVFDTWLVTAPRGPAGNTAPILRRRWLAALKTTLLYALAEPLLYALMSSTTDNAMWCFLMGSYGHLLALPVAFQIQVDAIKSAAEEHKRLCTTQADSESGPEQQQQYHDVEADAVAEKPEGLEAGEQEAEAASEGVSEITEKERPQQHKPCIKHQPSASFQLVPLLPALSTAASNAGLLYYSRYLKSEDSQVWLDRFAFGWTAIALLCAFTFLVVKGLNPLFAKSCNRIMKLPAHGTERWWEIEQRVVCWLLLISLRSVMRSLLGQPVITTATSRDDWTTLQLDGPSTDGHPGTAPGGESNHYLDQMLSKVPAWWGWVWPSIFMCYSAWNWYNERRKKRQQERTEAEHGGD